MRKATKALGCIITLCLTIGMLVILTNITERKASDEKYRDFFRDRDFDVLLMGTSHVINGVYPMELWNDYGITSFNFGGHSNKMATTYWVMENALDYVTPKVMIIDCLGLSSDTKCSDIFSYLHLSLDAFPLTLTKIRAIWDLLDDSVLESLIASGNTRESDEPRTRIGLLWDFSVYHSRWNQLVKNDFVLSPNLEKGAESRIAVVPSSLQKIDSSMKTEPGHVGEIYLRRMIESCQKRGIDVVLTFLPFPASEQNQKDANRAYDIAAEYDVPYLDFLDMEGIIDYQTDLYDNSSHLNPSGARKVTAYLGEFLTQTYDLPDRRGDANYSYWERDYQKYEGRKNRNLTNQNDMINYLMLLSGDNADTMIYIQNSEIFSSELVFALINNIGINTDELNENTDFILVRNQEKDAVVLNSFTEEGKTEATRFGKASVTRSDSEEKDNGTVLTLTVDGWETMRIEEDSNLGLQVDVYRHGSLVDSVKFSCTVDPVSNDVHTSSAAR